MRKQEFKNYKTDLMPHRGLVSCGLIADETYSTGAIFEFFMT